MRGGSMLLAGCILAGIVFLTGLGFWQLHRLSSKEALIARVEAGLDQKPVALSQIERAVAAGEDIEYRPAMASGRYLHDREAHYFATHQGAPGYFVYTPLQVEGDRLVYVNRGFVPMGAKDAQTRLESQIGGRVEVRGLARSAPAERPNGFVPDNDTDANVFYWKSLEQMAALRPGLEKDRLLPFFLDADDSPVPGGHIAGGVTRIEFPNNHLQYALTWFGLAGALAVVGGLFLRSRMAR